MRPDAVKILPSIILIAAAANVGTSIAPRGKTRRTVLFAVSLATLLALLLPILTAFDELPALPEDRLPDTVGQTETTPEALVTGEAERALREEIARRFGVTPAAVAVTLPAGDGPGSVTVVLHARDAGLQNRIAAWLKTESRAAVTVQTEGEAP